MRTTWLAVVALAASVVLAGCSDTQTSDFCTQYDDAVARADDFRSVRPSSQDVDKMRDQAQQLQDELDQLQAVSEGRLDTAISAMRTAVNDFVNTARDRTQDTIDTVRPALQDAKDEIQDAWSVVEQIAVNECGES